MILDPVRIRLLKLIQTRDTDLKKVSVALGKNAAYIHQFIYRGTPKVLPEDVREVVERFRTLVGDAHQERVGADRGFGGSQPACPIATPCPQRPVERFLVRSQRHVTQVGRHWCTRGFAEGQVDEEGRWIGLAPISLS